MPARSAPEVCKPPQMVVNGTLEFVGGRGASVVGYVRENGDRATAVELSTA
ncbi:hypothetical protein [Micromonospora sp. NPDC005220]|uniref:hypothetical protein n=1 Tax=Micromonospora sp. NPDC005220 TaxID=3155589 RepID=UPI0033AF7FB1